MRKGLPFAGIMGRVCMHPCEDKCEWKKVDTLEKTFDQKEARAEAERCLNCGYPAEVNETCWYCLPCEIECPVDALEVRMPYLVR